MENIIPAVLFSILVIFSITEFALRNKQIDSFQLIPEGLGRIIAWLKYRNIKRNSTQYYRDILTDISPLLVSYVENYHLKYENDIVAFLLKMYKDGKIDFQNGEIIKGKEEIVLPDERRVYNLITSKFTNDEKKAQLENEMYEEAVKNKYIKEEQNLALQKITKYIFAILALGGVFALVVGNADSNQPEWLNSPGSGMFFITYVILGFLLYTLYGYMNYNRGYVLTSKGKDLRAKIFGLKRFIKDFSMLNQREKEDVMLWDDFLVYSVIFGQNKKIKRDILKHYNLDYKMIERRITKGGL